ncbi:MAG: hypothetical protein HY219_01925 [Candidatus Staskawiczbacteria bacterium]|nr:hypothetical protein [Candidatus Staskawiczbacteria bacterium]
MSIEARPYRASLQLGIPTTDLRPVDMFTENVVKDGQTLPRFQKITDQSIIDQLKVAKKEMYQ